MPDQPSRPAGWGWPGAAKKAHYFPADDIVSLCGKWMFRGERETDGTPSKDDCVACTRKLAAT